MCIEAVEVDPWQLHDVPDCFMTEEQAKKLYEDYYDYDDDEIVESYEGYKKRKAQKAKLKQELIPISCHPTRMRDWCMT